LEEAFWDSSALVSLCVIEKATQAAQTLSAIYDMAVWWAAPVEMRGAFARLLRMHLLTLTGHMEAQVTLDRMRRVWHEVHPSEQLREQAERLVDRFPLKAADAQQLAAAMTWCLSRPRGRVFISGDTQVLNAAGELGFKAIEL
jgi:predicted nucleic acid-binding protein